MGGERRGRQEPLARREDEGQHQGPEERREPWRPEQGAVNQEDVGRPEHREGGERQELLGHQGDAGLRERQDGEVRRCLQDAERPGRREPEEHPTYQPSHKPSPGRRAVAAG